MNDFALEKLVADSESKADEIFAHLLFAENGVEALKALGSLLNPVHLTADEAVSNTLRSEVAAVFAFFGAAMKPALEAAYLGVDTMHGEHRAMQKAALDSEVIPLQNSRKSKQTAPA